MVLRKKGICATEVGKVVGRWTPVGEDNEKGSVLGRPFVVNTWRSEKRRTPPEPNSRGFIGGNRTNDVY